MKKSNSGFTLLEVLLAIALFALSIVALVHTRGVSLQNVARSERLATALQLVQLKMTEMEIKFQGALDKNGLASTIGKENGQFEPPHEAYSWSAELKEAGLELTSEQLVQLLLDFGVEQEDAESQVESQKLVMTNLNKTLKENFSELIVTVEWDDFGHKSKVPVVTHLIPSKPKIELKLTAE